MDEEQCECECSKNCEESKMWMMDGKNMKVGCRVFLKYLASPCYCWRACPVVGGHRAEMCESPGTATMPCSNLVVETGEISD
jgi:hypothetical protein